MSSKKDSDDGIDLEDFWADFKDQAETAEDPIEQADLAEELVEAVAEAKHNGDPNKVLVDRILKESSKAAKLGMSVVKLREMRDEELERLNDEDTSSDGGSDPTTVYELVSDHLVKLIVYTPTDASATAKYHWHFNTEVEVETEQEHRSLEAFAKEYFAASGSEDPVASKTPEWFERSWVDYIRDVIANFENRVDKTIPGRRTLAVEDLQSKVASMELKLELKDAVRQRQLHLNIEDEVIEVPNGVINHVLRDYETVAARDLQVEMDSRGVREGTVRQTKVCNSNVRLWPVNEKWAGVDVDWDDMETDDTDPEDRGRELA